MSSMQQPGKAATYNPKLLGCRLASALPVNNPNYRRRFGLDFSQCSSLVCRPLNALHSNTDHSISTKQISLPSVGLLAATSTLTAPILFPAAAEAASNVYRMVDDTTLTACCAAFGITSFMLTLTTTGRFIMSFYPGIERAARQARGPLLMRMFVMMDGLLDPAQRGLFGKKEEGDVNYAAIFYLAALSAVLEVLFGDSGVLFHWVPDSSLLRHLNYLIYFQHMVLLPQWTMAVFRWFGVF